jgi:hypothetical protein
MKLVVSNVFVILMSLTVTGCGKTEAPPPQTVASKEDLPSVAKATGTIKVEFEGAVDPKAIVTIDGNEYSRKDLEQPIEVKEGKHLLVVNQPGLHILPRDVTIEKGQRKVARVFDPERRAAEWILRIGGGLRLLTNGEGRLVQKLEDLPQTPFQITDLNSEGKPVTDTDFEVLDGLTHVRVIYVRNVPISGTGFVHLRGLSELVELSLEGTKISDAALENLKGLTNLRILRLDGNQLTDAGLIHLKALKNLQLLELKGTSVSESGVADFKTAVPNCNVLK